METETPRRFVFRRKEQSDYQRNRPIEPENRTRDFINNPKKMAMLFGGIVVVVVILVLLFVTGSITGEDGPLEFIGEMIPVLIILGMLSAILKSWEKWC